MVRRLVETRRRRPGHAGGTRGWTSGSGSLVTREISIGDYILSGGEPAARGGGRRAGPAGPGVLGDMESALSDSFETGILDSGYYTRPEVFRGMRVPRVLMTGDHERIRRQRRDEALLRTLRRRPDLLSGAVVPAEIAWLQAKGWTPPAGSRPRAVDEGTRPRAVPAASRSTARRRGRRTMDVLKNIEAPRCGPTCPEFGPGDTIKVQVKVIEGEKERLQVFQGVVLGRRGAGLRASFTVRKVSDGVGVERIFPLHSPSIAKIEVVRQGAVRRAKIYYLSELKGKSARIKEKRQPADGQGRGAQGAEVGCEETPQPRWLRRSR